MKKVVSLFSGIGAFEKALINEKIPFELINFSEIDEPATGSYCSIYGTDKNKNLGDISNINTDDIEDFNLLVGGSPCTDFSIAGKTKGAMWHCDDCDYEYNPLTVHFTKRKLCPHCNSKKITKTRSSLIIEYLRVLYDKKPEYFVYENVKNLTGKMFKESFDIFINELKEYGYKVYYKVLNAKNFDIPQNRERVFVVGIRNDINKDFVFPSGNNNYVSIKDILQENVDEKYYINNEATKKLIKEYVERKEKEFKQNTINKIGQLNSSQDGILLDEKGISNTHTAGHDENKIKNIGLLNIRGSEQIRRVYDNNGISPTLDTCQGGNRQVKIVCEQRSDEGLREFKDDACGSLRTKDACGDKRVLETPICVASRGRYIENPSLSVLTTEEENNKNKGKICVVGNYSPSGHEASRVIDKEGIAPTVKENHGTVTATIIKVGQVSSKGSQAGMVYDSDGVSQRLCAGTHGYAMGNIYNEYRIRKLTPRECFRLMGFSDEDYDKARYYTKEEEIQIKLSKKKYKTEFDLYENEKIIKMSDSQAYKQAGNSIVVKVLMAIFKQLFS